MRAGRTPNGRGARACRKSPLPAAFAVKLRPRNARCTQPRSRQATHCPTNDPKQRERALAGRRRPSARGQARGPAPLPLDLRGELARTWPVFLSSRTRGNCGERPWVRPAQLSRSRRSPAPWSIGTARIRKVACRDSAAAHPLPADAASANGPCCLSPIRDVNTSPHSVSSRRESQLH